MKPVEKDPAEDLTERSSVYSVQPFGKYMLVQKIAEGGMAEIFLAKQTGVEGFERNVVIKRMLAHLSRQSEFVDMFLDEARLASRLNHPNIIPIYDLGLVEGSYFICMEYLPGEDLSWVLRQARARLVQLPVDVAVRIIIDAARGLHYAHEFADETGTPLQIVHRDVSPGNIYIGYEGQVKVLDFGIAKAESRVTTTTVGIVKGKAMYMSPEQSRAEPVDRRSDIYALGVTLYEALTISRPFMRDSPQGMMHAVLRGDFEPPRQRRPEIPVALEDIVLKAMALDADRRFATAAEMADALEHVIESATPTGGGVQVGRFLRDLCGDFQMSQKTRIPTLASLLREQKPQKPSKQVTEERPPADGLPSPAMQPKKSRRTLLVGALGLGLMAAALVGWRIHGAAMPEGCRPRYGSDASDSIVLGAALPLSINGRPDENGQEQLVNAMRLALDEINQRDGVGGRRFAVRVCDDGGDVNRLREQVRWLVDHEKVPAMLTTWSSHTIAAVSQTLPKGVVVMTAEATSPELSALPAAIDGVRMLWRTAPSDAIAGQIIPELIAHDKMFAGVQRVAILYQDDPYGQGLGGVIAATLPKKAPTVELLAIQYPFRGDVTSAVKQLAAFKPDLTVFVGFANDGVHILNLAADDPALQRKNGHRWFFCDAVKEPNLFTGLAHPEEIDGMYGIESADGGGAEAASFQARFHARFLHEAGEQTYSANRYDAMYLLALGVAWAAGQDGHGVISGKRIAEGLTHLSSGPKFSLTPEHFTAAKALLQSGKSIDIEGASGKLDFDPATGEAPAAFQLWRIKGQSFVHDRRIEWPIP